jgi:hypothetical protein
MNPIDIRTLAEQSSDPDLYEQAAAEFRAIGWTCSSDACRDRANHYRQIIALAQGLKELATA